MGVALPSRTNRLSSAGRKFVSVPPSCLSSHTPDREARRSERRGFCFPGTKELAACSYGYQKGADQNLPADASTNSAGPTKPCRWQAANVCEKDTTSLAKEVGNESSIKNGRYDDSICDEMQRCVANIICSDRARCATVSLCTRHLRHQQQPMSRHKDCC